MKVSRLLLRLALFSAMFLVCSAAFAQDEQWPREIQAADASILIYQPQPESLQGDTLTARAAVSITKGAAEPLYGTAWFNSQVATDRESRTATLLNVDVTKAVFPTAAPDIMGQYESLVESEMGRWNLVLSIDTLLTGLAASEGVQPTAATDLGVTPPRIIFTSVPSVLVLIDGTPELRPAAQSGVMRVINTPFLIALDQYSRSYYLYGGGVWYNSGSVVGPWTPAGSVPTAIVSLATGPQPAAAFPSGAAGSPPPQIIVSTEPAELIVSAGAPTYSPLDYDGQLLYMANTDSDVILDVQSQRHYVLLAGRWFAGDSLRGPWTYVPGDRLPPAFANIPTDSPRSRVLASVPGTPVAYEAVADATIPQTAVIQRADAKLQVEYEGDPVFRPVEGTSFEFAINTPYAIFRIGRGYYCCNQAVWFSAPAPFGPWVCADSVPVVIQTIPPTCPWYNCRFAYIYRSTPEEIYCGYTSGYVNSYVVAGTVVYGTGYYYRPYIGRVYCYPRSATWGFRVQYDDADNDWGFSLGIAAGFFDFDASYAHGWNGWWGPRGCRIRDYDYRRHVYVTRNEHVTRNVFVRPERVTTVIYDRPVNRDRGVRVIRGRDAREPGVATNARNDVFADRQGNVYKRSDKGWSKLEKTGWAVPEPLPPTAERARRAERPATPEEKMRQVTPFRGSHAAPSERPREGERGSQGAPPARAEEAPRGRLPLPGEEGRVAQPTPSEERGRVRTPLPGEEGRVAQPAPEERGRVVQPAPEERGRVAQPAPPTRIEERPRTTTPEETGRTAVRPAPEERGRVTTTPPERGRAPSVEKPRPSETSTQTLEREYSARERARQRTETRKSRTAPPQAQRETPRVTREAKPRETSRQPEQSKQRQTARDGQDGKQRDGMDGRDKGHNDPPADAGSATR
jgi:hypothetical protein